tara:strand:+ start:4765 stop:6765 length:2001 start_codon:yes stop_codon:yes gene_type:complete
MNNTTTTKPSVTVQAVPFNAQTQQFGSVTPSSATTSSIAPTSLPQTQNISTFNTEQIRLPAQPQTTIAQPTTNYALSGLQNIPTPVADVASNISSTMLKLLPEMQGQSQELAAQKKTLGVDTMRTNLQNLSTQILQRQAELQQQDVSLAQGLQNIEDQTIPMEFITGQQLSLEKRANLAKAVKVSQINMLNASAVAAQGNIALANDLAQEAVDLKYAPMREMYTTLQAQLQAIQPMLNAEEKKVAAQQSMMANTQKQLLDIKADQQKNISSLLLQSQANGIDSQTYTRALNAYNRGASDLEIAGIIGPYGGKEYLANKDIVDYVRGTVYNGTNQLTVDNGFTLDLFKKGIASTESSNNYKAIGPATSSGDKAYGKYQVMGANIPSWTKEAGLGSMTAQQFLNSPEAQEKVFEFQSMKNYGKYGNWDDVASVWFSGRPLSGNVSSDGYNTVPQYVAKVRTAMGVPAQPTALSMVTNPTAELWGKEYQKNGDINKVPKQFQTMALAYANQNVQNTQQQKDLQGYYELASGLLNAPGKQAAVGAGFKKSVVSLIPFVGPEAIPGTERADFEAKFNQLKDSLAMANLDKLKGAMSDKDIQFLRNVGTSLSLDMSESTFDSELIKVTNLLQEKLLRNGGNILGGSVTDSYYQTMVNQFNNTTSTPTYGYNF